MPKRKTECSLGKSCTVADRLKVNLHSVKIVEAVELKNMKTHVDLSTRNVLFRAEVICGYPLCLNQRSGMSRLGLAATPKYGAESSSSLLPLIRTLPLLAGSLEALRPVGSRKLNLDIRQPHSSLVVEGWQYVLLYFRVCPGLRTTLPLSKLTSGLILKRISSTKSLTRGA